MGIPKGAAAEGRSPLWGRPQAYTLFVIQKILKKYCSNISSLLDVALPKVFFEYVFEHPSEYPKT